MTQWTCTFSMLFNRWWHEPPNMKQTNTLQKIQYLNYITGIPVLYKILKKNHNTGTNLYASIVHNTSIPVLRSPSTGDPCVAMSINHINYFMSIMKDK